MRRRPCDERRALPDAHRGACQVEDRCRQARGADQVGAARQSAVRRSGDDRREARDTGRIAEIAHQVRGCLLCQASAARWRRLPSAAMPPASPSCATTPNAPSAGRWQGARAVRRLRARRRAQVAPRMRAAAVRGAEGCAVIGVGPRRSVAHHENADERHGMARSGDDPSFPQRRRGCVTVGAQRGVQ